MLRTPHFSDQKLWTPQFDWKLDYQPTKSSLVAIFSNFAWFLSETGTKV